MARVALASPTVVINNVPVLIVPNSFEFDPGYGEINVRNASIGAGQGVSIHTENAESQIGRCKFQVYVTEESRALIASWKSLVGLNVITAVQVGSIPVVINGASMINNPTFAASVDGTVDVEFKGDRTATI